MVAGVCIMSITAARPLYGAVHSISLDAPINAIQVEYVDRAMSLAASEDSEMFIIELNTPGGLADDMQEIINLILTSKIPVCTYVYPPGGHAASAGFFILVSADVAAMAPGTRTGSAHPVMSIGGILPIDPPSGSGSDKASETDSDDTDNKGDGKVRHKSGGSQASILMDKVREDFQAFLRAITEHRGRNTEAAELAVSESRSYTDGEALENGLVELVASSTQSLVEMLDGREITLIDGSRVVLDLAGDSVVVIEKTFRESALEFLTNPNVAFLLFLIGALLIYVEVTHAGMVLPGVVGGILLLLAVMGFSFLPINATGVILMLAAIGLFVAEVMIQGFGVLGIAGVVCLALGGIMLVDLPEEGLQVDPYLAVSAAITFGLISLFLMGLAVRALRSKAVTGAEGLIDLRGKAFSDLKPGVVGKVFLRGEYWDALSQHMIKTGDGVRCTGLNGLVLDVEPDNDMSRECDGDNAA